MTVIIGLNTGDKHRVDRRARVDQVAKLVEEARQAGLPLMVLEDDSTPSRAFYIAPYCVVSIIDDGY